MGLSRIPPYLANPVPMIRNGRMKTQEGPAFSNWSSILHQTQVGRECRKLAPVRLRVQMMRDVMAEIPERRIEARIQAYIGKAIARCIVAGNVRYIIHVPGDGVDQDIDYPEIRGAFSGPEPA